MHHPIADGERHSQFLRGALDICLLALLEQSPSHAYELADRFAERGLVGIGYGTLYPLVTRMRRLGLIEEHREASPAGPPRKVFRPSPAGRQALASWSAQWLASTAVVRSLLIDTGALAPPPEETPCVKRP